MRDFRELMTDRPIGDRQHLFNVDLDTAPYRSRLFEHLNSPSGVALSIQASFSHYSFPRMTLDVWDYESFELAVFDSDECMCAVNSVLGESNNFAKSFKSHYSEPVYGNVPVAKIQQLCEALGIVG